MNNTRLPHTTNCVDLMIMAERELAAFLSAVTELYGAEQAEMAAEVWLDELEMIDILPGPASRDWRKVTVAALARLASLLTVTKISAMTSTDCSCPVFLA